MRYAPFARIGNIFTDAVDTGLSVADAIVHAVPGGDWLATAAKNGATWVGNAAKTPEGLFVLQVITSGLATTISQVAIPSVSGMQTVGPVLASVVFALPGSVAGKPFLRAYVEELSTRIVQTGAVLTANPALAAGVGASLGATLSPVAGATLSQLEWTKKFQEAFSQQILKLLQNPEFQASMNSLAQTLGTSPDRNTTRRGLRNSNLTAPQTAAKYGVRADAAATAINGSLQTHAYGVGSPEVGSSEFDVYGRPNQTYDITEKNTGAKPGELEPTRGGPIGVPNPNTNPVLPPGSFTIVTSNPKRGVIGELMTAAVLLSPLWVPFAYKRWKARHA